MSIHLLPMQKIRTVLIIIILFVSCGSDMVEDIIERYDSGSKKVYVRYNPNSNVLEKHFFNAAGEMVYIEWDSLSYYDDFKKFMLGTWVIDKMTVDGEIMFEKDSVMNPDSLPNIYSFTSKELLISGPQYKAEYKVQYLDSTGMELQGSWTYGNEGEETYRTGRKYQFDYFQILSYYTIIWSEFLRDTEKEEEVILRRVYFPKKEKQASAIPSPESE